jgi:hypothetical protein
MRREGGEEVSDDALMSEIYSTKSLVCLAIFFAADANPAMQVVALVMACAYLVMAFLRSRRGWRR